jgi:hypothetical protein
VAHHRLAWRSLNLPLGLAESGKGQAMTRVMTPFYNAFQIPNQCVNCGQPAGMQKIKVSGSKQYTKRIETLNLEFPVCDSCAAIRDYYENSFKPLTTINWIAFVLAMIVSCVALIALNDESDKGPIAMPIALGLMAAVFIYTGVMRAKIRNEKKSDWETYKNINRSATILSFQQPSFFDKTGNVIFKFQNAAYAVLFSTANMGKFSEKDFGKFV